MANQIRGNFSCHKLFEHRNWRPLAYWLFDVCAVNAFVIWRRFQPEKDQKGHRLHEQFQKALIRQLLLQGEHSHKPGKLGTQRRCAWGLRHPEHCHAKPQKAPRTSKIEKSERQKRTEHRQALKAIINGVRPAKQPICRPRQTTMGCITCGVHLCVTEGCFHRYHVHLLEDLV